MSKGRALVLILASLAWLGALASQAGGAGAQASTPTVLSLQLKGVVDPFMASYVERGIKEASRNGDAAVLLTIDTPGGLDSSMRQIIESILASPTEVICYASPSGARAASAGTFIMMGCPINAMAPGTNVGAAHPVGVSGAIEMEKVTNDAAAFIRSLAERWHRNADWAEQSVRNAVSASAEDALSMHVVDLVAPSQTALFDNIAACLQGTGPCPSTGDLPQIKGTAAGQALTGLSAAAVTPYGMSITERLFHSLANPDVAFLLINIGFIALLVWIFHPGFHVPLAVGIICMVLGLAILQTLPVRLVGVILLLVSAVLFVLDVKAKAHGALTAGGIATLILGGLLLFNPAVPNARVSPALIVFVALAAGVFTMFTLRALLSAKKAPVVTGQGTLVGETGQVVQALSPTGLVKVRHETWTAESANGERVPKGAPVRIVRVKSVKLFVEPVPHTAGEASAGAEPTMAPAGTPGGQTKEGTTT